MSPFLPQKNKISKYQLLGEPIFTKEPKTLLNMELYGEYLT